MSKPLVRLSLTQTNRPLDVITHWHSKGDLELNPPYQRGDVWGAIRQRNLIRSIMLGIPIPSIIINDRFGAGWKDDYSMAVIDGKQRITAVLKFLTGQLFVPSWWFEKTHRKHSKSELAFDELTDVGRRCFQCRPMPFSEGKLKTLKEEMEVFELVNYGGVPQGESDLP